MNNQVIDYKRLGNEVVEEYFKRMDDNTDKNLLEEIISNLAQRESLNNEEIYRICQYANTKIFLRLYKATKDKAVEFDVADPERIINPNKEKQENLSGDLDFDDSYYIIKKEETPEEKESFDINELISLLQNLIDERDNLEIKLMEKRPLLATILANRLQREPKLAAYTAKTVGAPEELLKEASIKAGLNEVPDIKEIEEQNPLVDENEDILQKIASYGKMKSRFIEVEDKIEKAASIIDHAAKRPLKSLNANKVLKPFNAYKKIKEVGNKRKDFKQRLQGKKLGNNINTNQFKGGNYNV